MTTTHWGWQYTHRKLLLLRNLVNNGPDVRRARDVYALDTGEFATHASLIKMGNVPPASCDTVKHSLGYTDKFGTVVFVHYFKEEELCHTVPVSMLALLEANATASEFLSLLQCADSHEEYVDRLLSSRDVEARFEALLNDPYRMEYSSLLHLTRVHFNDLPLAKLMRLVAAVARFSLDASDFTIGEVVNLIQRSIKDRVNGAVICMELRRNHCRHLLYFKTILFLHGWRKMMLAEQREDMEALIHENPMEAIHRMWSFGRGDPITEVGADADWIIDNRINLLRQQGSELNDSDVIRESVDENRLRLRSMSAGEIDFRNMRLLNPILADGTEVHFPNSVKISALDYFNEKYLYFTKLDVDYKSMRHQRFHMRPDSPGLIYLPR